MWVEEYLGDDATVYVHFLVMLVVNVHIDQDW
jgi:hypothetical protein